ncbi:MAG: L,D-transpeptidase family protein [Sphingomonas sp.]|nr:L,D-transpeptidase family protein [Sphingomonas sp.]
MRATTSQNRRYWIAGTAILAVAAGAFGLGRLYPPAGPSAGAIAAAQGYVEGVAGEEIPASGRYVLVDAASARLFMIEDGRVRDTMRVIVGKPAAATPALRSALYYATLNPYWNVPFDLAQRLIAPRVLKDGTAYLTERGYEIVSGFGANAQAISPGSVDWQAVASGEAKVHVRQRPGAANSMGQMKFDVANASGIYLHDTPNKDLFAKVERNLSNGCVRLEDAPRFARWLLGKDAPLGTATPEQHVALPGGVPITIAYLDARAQMQVAGLQ